MNKVVVLDATALLCVLNGESGAERVAQVLPQAAISAASLSEVVIRLRERGLRAEEVVEDVLGGLHLDICPLTLAQAYAAGHLCFDKRGLGLTLGDRACRALAAELGVSVLTADQAWADAEPGIRAK